MKLRITIIIAVKNSEKTIQKCINSLFRLNYPELEILFVNDGSTDKSREIIENAISGNTKPSNIKCLLLNNNGIGASAARNTAIEKASGDYVAFTDDDCVVDEEWLNELIKGFNPSLVDEPINSDFIAGVGGNQLSPEDDSSTGKNIYDFMKSIGFITDYLKSETLIEEVDHNPTCNAIYKKAIFDKVGKFNEKLWPGEDVELDYRLRKLGYRLFYNPEAMVYHYRADSYGKFFRMMFNYGRAQGTLVRKYGFFRIIQLVPALALIYLSVLIYSLFSNSLIAFNLITGTMLFSVFWAFLETFNIKKAVVFLRLAFITLTGWNLGFLKGLSIRI